MPLSNIVARQAGIAGTVVCTAPDVCKTPSPAGPIPIPYMVVSMLTFAVRAAKKTQLTGKPVFTMNSRLSRCIGDEPGVAGGVVSNVNMGFCRPISFNPTILVEGQPVIESTHVFGMNCAGPEGIPNTVGMLAYFE